MQTVRTNKDIFVYTFPLLFISFLFSFAKVIKDCYTIIVIIPLLSFPSFTWYLYNKMATSKITPKTWKREDQRNNLYSALLFHHSYSATHKKNPDKNEWALNWNLTFLFFSSYFFMVQWCLSFYPHISCLFFKVTSHEYFLLNI